MKNLSNGQLKNISGGKISLPVLPTWNQLISSACGFFDGLSGSKNNKHC
ncbi:hypothetical protein [Companilactobacillus sp. HBUAS56257]